MVSASTIVIGITVFMPGVLALTYILSVTSHHVASFWPYISYTGNHPIESCIFSFGLNLASAIYTLIVFLRYCQILTFLEETPYYVRMNNNVAGASGAVGALGMSISASFQPRNCHICHNIGFTLCFVGTSFYIMYQTHFSLNFLRSVTPRLVRRGRATICCSVTMVQVAYATIFLGIWLSTLKAPKYAEDSWHTSVLAILEWILFILELSFFALFYTDFKRISLERDQITFSNLAQEPSQIRA